jgi:hypothetical protein
MRVKGTALLDTQISLYSSIGAYCHGALGATSTTIDQATLPLDLSQFDSRLITEAKGYSYFVYRSLNIFYIPLSSQNEKGVVAISVMDDTITPSSFFSTPFYTATNVGISSLLTAEWSNSGSVYQPFSVNYRNPNGTRLWPVSYANGAISAGTLYPLQINALAGGYAPNSTTNQAMSTSYNLGQLYVEYVVDFYEPSYLLASGIQATHPLDVARSNRRRLAEDIPGSNTDHTGKPNYPLRSISEEKEYVDDCDFSDCATLPRLPEPVTHLTSKEYTRLLALNSLPKGNIVIGDGPTR